MSIYPAQTAAFSAGVLSPGFWGRFDIEQFSRGLAKAENFYIDWRGGVKNRPGTRFMTDFGEASSNVRLIPFILGKGENDILLAFVDNNLYGFQNGVRLYDGNSLLLAPTPWDNADLDDLRFAQRGLSLRITHSSYDPYDIVLSPGTATWTLNEVDMLQSANRPTNTSSVPSTAGTASYVVCVTTVDAEGKESLAGRPFIKTAAVNVTTTAGSYRHTCNKVNKGRFYRWYRSIISEGTQVTIAQEMGFIGETESPHIVDANLVPDFSRTPPVAASPFAGGQVLQMDATAPGASYGLNDTSIIKTSGPGSGLIAFPVIFGGEVVDVLVTNWGRNYNIGTSVFSVSGGGGAGATVSAVDISPAGERNPRLVAYFQQRCVFASTTLMPNGVWGSAVARYDLFSARRGLPADDEAYAIFPDVPGADRLQHIVPLKDSLLLFHHYGVDRLVGTQSKAITPSDHAIDPQSSIGAGRAPPVLINGDVVYASPRGDIINSIRFQGDSGYSVQTLNDFVSHYFPPYRRPLRFAYQAEPDKLLWVLMDDGKLYTVTYAPDKEVYAWAEQTTLGKVTDICCINENDRDVIYLVVRRNLATGVRYCIEELMDRRVTTNETSWFVDCGIASTLTEKNVFAALRIEDGDDINRPTFIMTSPSGPFLSSHVGWHIRAANGLYLITHHQSATEVRGVVIDPPGVDMVDLSDGVRNFTTWYLDPTTKSFSGLTHLAGKKVSVLADGSVYLEQLISDAGVLTLSNKHSRVVVGFPYEAELDSLPLPVPDSSNKKKRVISAHVRIWRSRGVRVGTLKELYNMRDTKFYELDQNLQLHSGIQHVSIGTTWEVDARLRVRQVQPLPAEILGFTLDIEV